MERYCIKCGNLIDEDDVSLLGSHCGRCTEKAKKAGFSIECVLCEHLELTNTPPCSLDIVIIENGKCKNRRKKLFIDDLVRIIKDNPYLFDLVN